MNSIGRELLNGPSVLMVASLLSVAFSAFQVTFNAQFSVLILKGIGVALGGDILFDITLGVITSAEGRERALAEAMQHWGEEWLKRVGNPASLDLRFSGSDRDLCPQVEVVQFMGAGADLLPQRQSTTSRWLDDRKDRYKHRYDVLQVAARVEVSFSSIKRFFSLRSV